VRVFVPVSTEALKYELPKAPEMDLSEPPF